MVGPPKHNILERLHTRFQAEPDDVWQALSQFLLHLLLPQVTTPVVIPEDTSSPGRTKAGLAKTQQDENVEVWPPWRLSSFEGLSFEKLQPLGAAEAAVGVAAVDQLLGRLSVEVQPLGLQVGTQRASSARTLIWRHTWRGKVSSV